MSGWIFQGNPDRFRIDDYLRSSDTISWAVRQRHLAPQMRRGDTVFLWRAKGRQSTSKPGIIAQATIIEPPSERQSEAHGFWIVQPEDQKGLYAKLHIKKRCLRAKEVIRRISLTHDPILKSHMIFRMANQTNYRISQEQLDRLAALVEKTGIPWSPEECLAGLWAFAQTENGKISKLPHEPVALVALTIGRLVNSVYNKVLNFRSIDPRDARKGLSSTNINDHSLWKSYFDPDTESLDKRRLAKDYHRSWTVFKPVDASHSFRDFGPPPADDPAELAMFARRVRNGQAQFRRRLLAAYDERCAITGWGPPEVLQAAHIWPHAQSGVNQPDNGILLRSDIHDLFDANLIMIIPETVIVRIAPELHGTPYEYLEGRRLRSRLDSIRPSLEYLLSRYSRAMKSSNDDYAPS